MSDDYSKGSPKDWLRYANSDLELAKISLPERVMLETLCFHAHQAVEKSLKAVLVFHNVEFPKTHSIRMLIDLLPGNLNIIDEVHESAALTDYAVMSRYPGDLESVDKEEYESAVKVASAVLKWAEELI